MATPRPYSERFILTSGPGHTQNYVVPAGRRAVIKRIDFVNRGSVAANAYLTISGTLVWSVSVPGSFQGAGLSTSHVAYGGETFGTITGGTDTCACVSGYLLSEV